MKFKFPFFIVLFVFCLVNTFSCKRGTSSNRTALDHAYACQDVLGPLPNFSCADAIEVPTTKNGTPVTFGPTAEGGNGSPIRTIVIVPGHSAWLVKQAIKWGVILGLIDGSENSDVVFITFCRDGGLGVIGHKYSTGETCFFSILDGQDNNNPPGVNDANYNDGWMSPSIVAQDNCQNCHMASPFLHTPAVDQLKNPNDTSELLVPMTGNGPYSIIGQEFSQPHTTSIQNSCTSCHRPQCTQHFENYPLDELVMPPPFENATDFDHSSISNADRQALRDWCQTLNL